MQGNKYSTIAKNKTVFSFCFFFLKKMLLCDDVWAHIFSYLSIYFDSQSVISLQCTNSQMKLLMDQYFDEYLFLKLFRCPFIYLFPKQDDDWFYEKMQQPRYIYFPSISFSRSVLDIFKFYTTKQCEKMSFAHIEYLRRFQYHCFHRTSYQTAFSLNYFFLHLKEEHIDPKSKEESLRRLIYIMEWVFWKPSVVLRYNKIEAIRTVALEAKIWQQRMKNYSSIFLSLIRRGIFPLHDYIRLLHQLPKYCYSSIDQNEFVRFAVEQKDYESLIELYSIHTLSYGAATPPNSDHESVYKIIKEKYPLLMASNTCELYTFINYFSLDKKSLKYLLPRHISKNLTNSPESLQYLIEHAHENPFIYKECEYEVKKIYKDSAQLERIQQLSKQFGFYYQRLLIAFRGWANQFPDRPSTDFIIRYARFPTNTIVKENALDFFPKMRRDVIIYHPQKFTNGEELDWYYAEHHLVLEKDGLSANYSENQVETILIGQAFNAINLLKKYSEKSIVFSKSFQKILLDYSSYFFFSFKMDEDLLEHFCRNFAIVDKEKFYVKLSNLIEQVLEQNEELCHKMLEWNGALIKYIPNDRLSKEMVMIALEGDALSILLVENKRRDVIDEEVRRIVTNKMKSLPRVLQQVIEMVLSQ